ncbi:DUF308 domain-containing protein [Bradyrhizobium ottawaense]|uniref:DUF308 domain-containing protein n=1 Tax=Bradyrhizobium ottawaense TaxID=931866 RepID=UPI0032217495
MTVYDSRGSLDAVVAPPLWVCALLGVVLIAAGLLALGDLAFATVVSVKLIGLIAIAAGAFEIAHAFWTKGWGGFLGKSCSARSTSPSVSCCSPSRSRAR